ncbi:MAG: NADH:ubiquinone oxidoreductase [Candidatus Aenigmarchaeota archaeon]|nr:NADH:ubiquinone oxidoreductase [Candidatus Aenigmarchaeota archaeon]
MSMAVLFYQHSAAFAVAVPLAAAFAVPLVAKLGKAARNAFVVLAVVFTQIMSWLMFQRSSAEGGFIYTLGASVPSLASPAGFPVRIVLHIDALSAFMAVISTTLAFVVSVYSFRYMKGRKSLDKYFALLLVMTAGMTGLVTTGDLFNMFVFLELLSVSSAGMIGYYGKGESAEAAFKYMTVSSIGALMVLFAAGMLYSQYNLLNIAGLADAIQFSFIDRIALVLLFAAFALKCGAVPMHMWVSDSYGEAPAPVSAFLVVASQAGLYALFRIAFTLFGGLSAAVMGWGMITLGMLSMFIGVTMAMFQKDIKRLMAYHAVSQTGYMLLGIGVGLAVLSSPVALETFGISAMEGGLFHVINHALYKGLLFLTAGAVIYRAGTRNLNNMSGLAHSMPVTTVLFIIGALSIAGLPPFNGFASKIVIYESVFMFNPLLSVIAMLVSILTLASFVKVFYSAFTGPADRSIKKAGEVPAVMWIPMGILAVLIIAFGLAPDTVMNLFVRPAVHALLNQAGYIGGVI